MNVTESPQENVKLNDQYLSQLTDMGFPLEACKWALYSTRNTSIDAAACWLMEHLDDPNILQPFNPKKKETDRAGGGTPRRNWCGSLYARPRN